MKALHGQFNKIQLYFFNYISVVFLFGNFQIFYSLRIFFRICLLFSAFCLYGIFCSESVFFFPRFVSTNFFSQSVFFFPRFVSTNFFFRICLLFSVFCLYQFFFQNLSSFLRVWIINFMDRKFFYFSYQLKKGTRFFKNFPMKNHNYSLDRISTE